MMDMVINLCNLRKLRFKCAQKYVCLRHPRYPSPPLKGRGFSRNSYEATRGCFKHPPQASEATRGCFKQPPQASEATGGCFKQPPQASEATRGCFKQPPPKQVKQQGGNRLDPPTTFDRSTFDRLV